LAAGIALTPLLGRYAPPRYRSEALIVVVSQQVPDNSVTPTVHQTLEERLPAITDRILSRSQLERIIREMDLYKAERARNRMEDVVSTMRLDISTSSVGKNVDSFRIGYVSGDAEKARKVTERLVSLYLDQNSKDRDAQADRASEFLETQLADAKRRLVEQQKKLEEYRKSHAGQRPSPLQGNLQAIQTHESELVELTRDYSAIQDVYANLLMKSQELAVAADLERRKIGEQFRLADEPSKPERPDNQRQRQAILASGAAAGLVLGLLIVGVLEYRDSGFGRAEEVHEALSVPVLASIPVMNSDRQCQAARRRRRAMDVGGAAALVAAVMVLALWGP
jgi:uncharacterized protein involved in exopolysaccharide biosynthesis